MIETMNLAKRIQKVTPSLTLAIEAKAKRLKQEGIDIISFSAGEPDFDTPAFVKQAAIDALNKGFTKYTPASGTVELRKAISEKLARENGLTYWLSYPEMVTLAGGKSVILQTRFKDGYHPSPQALEKLITKKTKVLILNSPSNPTGAVLPRELLEAIVRIAKKYSFFILSDEIYEKLIFDGGKHYSIGSLDPEILSRTITVGGASKAYAMTGWRLGFSAAPKPIAEACGSLQSHSTSNPTSFAQVAYLEALKSGESEAKKMS